MILSNYTGQDRGEVGRWVWNWVISIRLWLPRKNLGHQAFSLTQDLYPPEQLQLPADLCRRKEDKTDEVTEQKKGHGVKKWDKNA